MSARQRVRTVVFALAITLAGCGGRATLPGGAATTTLEVVNRATLDMNIYAVTGAGARERLGTAGSLATTRFTIPDRLVTALPLRFQADPVGSSRMHFSHEIPVIRGDTIVLQIPPA